MPSLVPLICLHFLVDIFTTSMMATLEDGSWWSIAPFWFVRLPWFLQWALVFEIPSYLPGLFGFFLLFTEKRAAFPVEPASPAA